MQGSLKTNIIISLQIEGFHCWPDAKNIFPKMGFLSERHRHIFYIVAKKKVYHSDRDVEIIDFKRLIYSYLIDKYHQSEFNEKDNSYPFEYFCEFGAMSCEMIAQELLEKFDLEYCSVLEDNENGAECIKE